MSRGPGIPTSRDHSTKGIRLAYAEAYGREWPHDDQLLRELASEIPSRRKETKVLYLLARMREDDT